MATSPPSNIVIIGGGIIGSTSAYYLSHHPSFDPAKTRITLLEASQIAGGASGKAGGLLALWAYPPAIVPLSFNLHRELADKYGGAKKWGYREVGVGQIECKARPLLAGPNVKGAKDKPTSGDLDGQGLAVEGDKDPERVSLQKRSKEALAQLKAVGVPKDLDWVDSEAVRGYEAMAGEGETAQVHPYLFTTSIAQLAQEKGVKVIYGSATAIKTSSSDGKSAVESVSYTNKDTGEEHSLPASHVIVSAGPWTQRLVPKAPISALRAHSVTIRPSRPVSAFCLFTEIKLPKDFHSARQASKGSSSKPHPTTVGSRVSPEIYARPNNEVYACGEGDHLVPLPATTALVSVDDNRCQDIVDQVGSISEELREGEVTAKQACYLPTVENGNGPIIGETKTHGLIIAAGHAVWGIQNSTGTGKLVSEIVFEGKAQSAKIGALEPRKFGL